MSTSRMMGRWLASSALAMLRLVFVDLLDLDQSSPMPLQQAGDDVLVAAVDLVQLLPDLPGEPSSMRTSRPVAKASIFSASMSNGLAVATSR